MRIFDGHCDTITRDFSDGTDLFLNNGDLDIARMLKAGEYAQIFAIFIDEKTIEEDLFEVTKKYISFFNSQIEKYSEYINLCRTGDEIKKAFNEDKAAAILSIEGLHTINGDISNIDTLYNLGVRSIGVTWNNSNPFAGGVYDPLLGLSTKGFELIEYLNDKGIMVDVSHLSGKSFRNIDEVAKKPYIASHSCSSALCNTFEVRNLSDEQIKTIANKGGIIGLNLCPEFLTNKEDAYVQDVVQHIEHIMNVGGMESIALGSDFDGIDKTPIGLEDPTKYLNLAFELNGKGYSEDLIEKIFFNNFFRVFNEICL